MAEEKRRIILDAAVRVFAHKGFHTSRVGDIAEEAGVAHGLLYHYFSSKDEVLETIFRENWGILVERIHAVEESGEPAREQLRHVAAILLRTWRHEPDVVRVLVREIVRSPEVAERIDDLEKPIDAIQRIVERGQQTGEFRADFDSRLAGIVFYGGIDELLTGWVLGRLPDGDDTVAAAESMLVDVVCAGLAPRPSAPPSSSAKRATPTLPPDTTDADAGALRVDPVGRAAPRRATAPLGSVTTFSRSKRNAIASRISASRDRDDLVDALPVHLEGQLAGLGPPAGRRRSCAARRCARARPRASERRVSSPASGSTPTTRIAGSQRLRGGRAAGDQPAAADGHDEQVELRPRPRAARARSSPGRPSRAGRRTASRARAPRSAASRAPISSRLSVHRSYVTISAP